MMSRCLYLNLDVRSSPANSASSYSWVGDGLQSGPTLVFSMWLSDFKTKTSFGFLIKKIRGRIFLLFQKVEKRARTAKNDVFGDFSKNGSFSNNRYM